MNRGKENVTNVTSYKIIFSTHTRGHVYKSVWKPEKGEKIDCHKDNCEDASMYDNHGIGAYNQKKHVPIECSTLVDNFLGADKKNRLTAVITRKRKREVGLVVPAEFTGRTKKQNIATIVHRELENKKVKYSSYFELSSVKYNGKMYYSILQ